MHTNDAKVAAAFAARCAAVRDQLWREMTAMGLRARDGWRIVESTRPGKGGLELVMRPIHLRLPSPPGMECVIWIDQGGADVGSQCFEGT